MRGFRTVAPDTSLVAIVLGSQQEFVHYCRRDEVPWSAGLRGYYSLKSNRIVLFDDPAMFETTGLSETRSETFVQHALASFIRPGRRKTLHGNMSGTAANTLIHETTHQVGFNIGVHSRLGGTPQWVVEGLATVLEAPGMRRRSVGTAIDEKINSERLEWLVPGLLEEKLRTIEIF